MKKAVLLAAAGVLLVAGTAAADTATSKVTFYPLPGAPTTLPLSESTRVGDVLYLSGQIGNTAAGQPVVAGGVAAEGKQAMDNIKSALSARGLSMADVFKCDVFITDIAQLGTFNSVYAGYFAPGRYPARSGIGVAGLTLGAHVEVECSAAVPH